MSNNDNWKSYEDVATYLLNQFADNFGLEKVEGKQKIKGLRAPTLYEIDAKGVLKKDSMFIIIECKRHTKNKQNKGTLNDLAYRIINVGANGGILVSPLGFQKGAKIIAESENIIEVLLNENASSTDYVLEFLNKICLGSSDTVSSQDELSIKMKCTICGFEHDDTHSEYLGCPRCNLL